MPKKLVFFLAVVCTAALVPIAVQAGPEKNRKCSDGIDNDGDGLIDNEDPDCAVDRFVVDVTLTDTVGCSRCIGGVGTEPYQGVMPQEFATPGQFVLQTEGSGRRLFFSFGPATTCTANPAAPKDCVADGAGLTVECPFPEGIRPPELESECAMELGFDLELQAEVGRGWLNIREAFAIGADPDLDPVEYILDMDPAGGTRNARANATPHPGERVFSTEVSFAVPKLRGKSEQLWFLTFRANDLCTDFDYLNIEAADDVSGLGGAKGSDHWEIGTFGGTKRGCLVKAKGGGPDELTGVFDLGFGLSVDLRVP